MPKHKNILNLNQELDIVQLKKKKSMNPNFCVDDVALLHRLHMMVLGVICFSILNKSVTEVFLRRAF